MRSEPGAGISARAIASAEPSSKSREMSVLKALRRKPIIIKLIMRKTTVPRLIMVVAYKGLKRELVESDT